MNHTIRSTKTGQQMGFIYCVTLPSMNWGQSGRDEHLENAFFINPGKIKSNEQIHSKHETNCKLSRHTGSYGLPSKRKLCIRSHTISPHMVMLDASGNSNSSQ